MDVNDSLVDALLHRRSRRFAPGVKLNGGPLEFASARPPDPLSAEEEAALAFAACGVTGAAYGQLPVSNRTRAGAIVQNLGLMCQALGLGGFPHFAAHPFGWPQALGFRMEDPRLSRVTGAGAVDEGRAFLTDKGADRCSHVQQECRRGFRNIPQGRSMQLECEVLITADRGFEHEHNLKSLSFGIVIIHVPEQNRFLSTALPAVAPGGGDDQGW